MEIKVVLTADDKLLKVLNMMATALVGMSVPTETSVVVNNSTTVEKETEKPVTKKESPTKTETAATKEETAPTEETKQEPEPEQTDEETTHGITLEEIRAQASKLAKAGKQAELKEIFNSFGAEKLSAIPEADYPAALEKIKEALGE